jgi:hypothetical protein
MTGLIKTATRSDVAGDATRGDNDLNLRTNGSDRAGVAPLLHSRPETVSMAPDTRSFHQRGRPP